MCYHFADYCKGTVAMFCASFCSEATLAIRAASDVKTHQHRIRRWLLTIAFLVVCAAPAFVWASVPSQADDAARSFRDHVVDRVTFADGTHLWGMSVSKKPLQILLTTKSLKAQQPDLYTREILSEFQKLNNDHAQTLANELQSEIDRQLKDSPDDQRRAALLKEMHERLTAQDADVPDVLILELPKGRTKNVELQTDTRRELCRLALLNGLQNVETSHWKSISAQLHAIPERERVRSAPAVPNQDDTELNLLKILAAVDLRLNTAARLIQNGSTVVDESAELDLAAVINSMLGGNVQSLLAELLNEGAAAPKPKTVTDQLPDGARRIADSKNQSTVLVSSFDFDLPNNSAAVTRRLFHKTGTGEWKLLLSSVGQSTSAEVRPEQVTAIENDPQIKSIADLTQSLGLGNEQFSSALRMGAVVQNALRNAEQQFEKDIQSILTAKNLRSSQRPVTIKLPEAVAP